MLLFTDGNRMYAGLVLTNKSSIEALLRKQPYHLLVTVGAESHVNHSLEYFRANKTTVHMLCECQAVFTQVS